MATNDDLAQARARLERFLERDRDHVGSTGRTLALLHAEKTSRAALLFHGLTASPAQFAAIAQSLFEQGFNVLVPRLPHHGHADRMSRGLADLTADQLTSVAAESLEVARGLGDRLTVAGFSMGGLLTGWIAQRAEVARAVLLMPFLGVIGVPAFAAPVVARLTLRLPNVFAWWHPIKRERLMPEHGYPRYTSHAIAHLYLLAEELFADARMQAPRAKEILVVTNKHESAVSNRAIGRLVASWRRRRNDIATFSFDDLPVSHDVIEPMREDWIVEKVYPDLLRAIVP